MKRAFSVLILVLAIAAVRTISQTAEDPMVGTWKFNAEKSKVGDKSTIFKSFTVSAVPDKPHTFRFKYEFNDGKTTESERIYDGKERPYTVNGQTEKDATAIYEMTGSHSHRNTFKHAGKTNYLVDATISPDGKTWSSQRKPIGPDGKVTDSDLVVSDKQ